MSDCLTLYLLDHKACIAGAESTEMPDTNMMSGVNKHIFTQEKTNISACVNGIPYINGAREMGVYERIAFVT